MRKKIGSLILAVSILSVLMPDTAMAARMERKPEEVKVQEASDQTKTDKNANKEARKDTSEDTGALLEGSGSEMDPYRIQDAEQLRLFADMVNGASGAAGTGICAVLTQNIDLSSVCGDGIGSWTPVGTKSRPYTGVFDGASFVVSGLYYSNSGASYAGLFGCNSGVIKNLGVAGDVAAGNYTGGVCGFNNGTITGCYSAAFVNGGRYTGGICGCNDGGSVNVCYNTGAVSGSKYVGGISGYNKNMVADCYNMGTVYGSSTSIGGICGYNRKTVSNCYNTGAVSGKGTDYIGSICGYNHSESEFLNSYYLITDTETENYGTAMTRERFESGEVCWLLNGGKSEGVVWYQTCGAGFPGFGGKTVYQVQMYRGSGDAEELVSWYTNDKNKSGLQTYTAAAAEENASGETHGHVYQEPEWNWEGYKRAAAVFTCQDCGEQITFEASVEKKTTAASCAAEGETVYTASVGIDEKNYQDTKTVKIAKTDHKPFDPVQVTPATCEKPGYKIDCWTCPACKQYFADKEGSVGLTKNQVVEPALGHDYVEGTWRWTDDYSSVNVDLTCRNCGTTDTKKGSIKRDTETKASCTEPGKTTYTATVKYNKQVFKDIQTVEGEMIPHKYSGKPEWEWVKSGESYTATAVFICSVCKTPQREPVEQITSTKTGGTDCGKPGRVTYTATIQFNNKKYTDKKTFESEAVPHTYSGVSEWDWSKMKPDDSSSVTATFICDVCKTPHKEQSKKLIESERMDGADCSKPSKITYKATVEFDGGTYTDDETVDGETNSHKYSDKIVWDWSKAKPDAPSTVSVTFTCEVCKKTFPEQAKEMTEIKRTKGSDCKTPDKITYKATVEFDGGKYIDEGTVDGEPGPHKYSDKVKWDWSKADPDDPASVTATFTCEVCKKTFPEQAKELIATEKEGSDCKTLGKITYKAIVELDGEKYPGEDTVDGEPGPHEYSDKLKWDWSEVKSGSSSTVTATFICDVCGEEESETVEATFDEPEEADCKTSVKITYTATALFNDKPYTDGYEDTIFGKHKLKEVPATAPTCVDDGTEKYWECETCGQRFSDSEGTEPITEVKTIPATGEHDLEFVRFGVVHCTICDKYYNLTVTEEGETIMTSLDEDVALSQEAEENDKPVSQSTEANKPEEEAATGELPPGLALEEGQKNNESLPDTDQAPEGDQGEQEIQEEQTNQEPQTEQASQEPQEEQNETAGQTEQIPPDGQAEQGESETQNSQLGNESGEGIADALEENAHDGVIYPVEEAGKADSEISDSQEGSTVNLRAESAANGAVQKEQEQMGRSLLICVAALAVFTGILLIFILRKKET